VAPVITQGACPCVPLNTALRAGVVGVQATGWLLQAAGPGSLAGWWRAYGAAAGLCVAGSAWFLAAARGERLFGSDAEAY